MALVMLLGVSVYADDPKARAIMEKVDARDEEAYSRYQIL